MTQCSFQGFLTYFQVIGPNRWRYKSIFTFIPDRIAIDRKPTDEYEIQQLIYIRKIPKKLILIVTCLLVSYMVVVIGPTYALIVKGEYHIPNGIVLPFTDPKVLKGYLINIAVQNSLVVIGTCGTFGLEILNTLFLSTLELTFILTVIEMRNLSANVEVRGFQIEHRLRDIFVRLQDIENYISEYKLYSYWRCFTQPMLTTLCVSLAILGQYLVRASCLSSSF